ncbi:MAG TPA: DNA internalization-related competence protein ComEC/Rec2, partial [Dehalococcoidia bacterium]|nr:DNA internalization-related competence protein ComEC/Rec2 [Dehalococcoidia bacterium]
MTLIFISISWLLGIVIGSYLNCSFMIIFISILPLAGIPFLRQHRATLVLASICLLFCASGILRTQANAAHLNSEKLRLYNDSGIIQIEGVVESDPDIRDTSTSFQFSARSVISKDTTEPLSGKAMVFTGKYPDYRYGDMIRVTGALETPQNFSDFDYKGYLNEKGIRSVISYPKIVLTERGQGNKVLSIIYDLRRKLSQSLSLALPEPQNALAQGILLGLRSTIPQELKTAFSKTGTTHILAISGLNLSIFIGICLAIGIWIFGRQRSIYIWLGLAITWIYTLISGMNAPVIRSALMVSLFLIAELLGRQRQALSALIFAAAVMTAVDPAVLHDVSFQLSFLAMTGLITISPGLIGQGRTSTNKMIRKNNFARATLNLCTDSIGV